MGKKKTNKNEQAVYYYSPSEAEIVADRIIETVKNPNRMQKVEISRPMSLDDYLAELFEEEGYYYDDDDYYDDDGDYNDYAFSGFNGSQPKRDFSDNIQEILASNFSEDQFNYDDQPLYVLDFKGENMNYTAPILSDESAKRIMDIATKFTNRQIRVIRITVITSPVGECLRVNFNTDQPEDDYLYIFMSAGSVLTFGPNAENLQNVRILFHQDYDGISAHEYY